MKKSHIITSEIFHSSRYENYLTAKQLEINARYIIYGFTAHHSGKISS